MKRVQLVFGDDYLVHALAYLIYVKRSKEAMMFISKYEWDQKAELIIGFTEKYGNPVDILYLSSLFCDFGLKKSDWPTLITNLLRIHNKSISHEQYESISMDQSIVRWPVPAEAPYVNGFIRCNNDLPYSNWIRILLYYIKMGDITRCIRIAHFMFISSGAWDTRELERADVPFNVNKGVDLVATYRHAFQVNGRFGVLSKSLKSPFGVMCAEIAIKYPSSRNIARFMLHSANMTVVLKCMHVICMYENHRIIMSYYTRSKEPLKPVECDIRDIVRALPSVSSTGFVFRKSIGSAFELADKIHTKLDGFSNAEKTILCLDLVPTKKFDDIYIRTLKMWRLSYTQLWEKRYADIAESGQLEIITIKYHPMDMNEYLTLTSRMSTKLTKNTYRTHWFVDPNDHKTAWFGPLTQYPNIFIAISTIFRSFGAVVPSFNVYKRTTGNAYMVSSPNFLPDSESPYPKLRGLDADTIDKDAAGLHTIADETPESMKTIFSAPELLKALLLFWTIGLNIPKGDDIVRNPNDGKWYILGFHKIGKIPNALGSSSTLYQMLFRSSHTIEFGIAVNNALLVHQPLIHEIVRSIEINVGVIKDTFGQYGCFQRLPSNLYERLEAIKRCIHL